LVIESAVTQFISLNSTTVNCSSQLVLAGAFPVGTAFTVVSANQGLFGGFRALVLQDGVACHTASMQQTASALSVVVDDSQCPTATDGGLSLGAKLGIAAGCVGVAIILVIVLVATTQYMKQRRTAQLKSDAIRTHVSNLGGSTPYTKLEENM
jgi:hypothetical protein